MPYNERDYASDDRPARRRSYRDDDYPEPMQTSVLGVFALVIGIGSLIASFIPCVGAVAVASGAFGLILGVIGIVVARKSGRQGTGLPIAGSIVSVFAIVIGGAWVLLLAAVFQKRGDPAAGGPEVAITAVDLDEEYDDNELAADKKYKNKTLVVTGKITKITRDDKPGKITVELEGAPGSTVDCHFDRDKQAELNALVIGEEVTIRGTCKGKVDGFVTLEKCALVRAQEQRGPGDQKPDGKTPDGPPIAITAEALEREYDANVVAADAKYKGKTLDLTGKVSKVSRNKPGKVTVELETEVGSTIECDFAANDAPQLATVAAGDELVIRGVCRGNSEWRVTLNNCTSIKKVDKPAAGAPLVVSAEALQKAYDENVVSADAKYKGKFLEVTGKVLRVSKNRPGITTVELGSEDGLLVLCYFQAKDAAPLAPVVRGDTVVIRGMCRGNAEGVPALDNCTFVKKQTVD